MAGRDVELAIPPAKARELHTYCQLFDHAPFGIYVVDSSLRVRQMNPVACNGGFRNAQPIIGRDIADVMRILWSESVADDVISRFRKTLDTGEPFYSRNFINPRKDLPTTEAYEWELHRITLPDGNFGVVCYYYDSTELRRAEADARKYKDRLRLEEERLRLTRSAAKVAAWEYSIETEIFSWSESVFELLGITSLPNTLAGFLSLLNFSGDRTKALSALTKFNRRQHSFEFEFRYAKPDGNVKLIAARGRYFYNQGSTLVLGMFIDTTRPEHLPTAPLPLPAKATKTKSRLPSKPRAS